MEKPESIGRKKIAAFELPSQPGNERSARDEAARIAAALGMDAGRIERLKTAVAEAVMNAMEHGNHYQADLPVDIEIWVTDEHLSVLITDQGANQPIPTQTHPDLEAKLAGEQSPRGWGLFLIENMVDELKVTQDDRRHTMELIFNLKGERE